ncbi:PCYCGC motif-containing (lipo)protein [Ectobacillus panaciterrae]|uniref:PCYCGC motif-containing (lipo)protein n=1 Tax=Ectobacillus panaciterrae TaxID=363872 RepID=UPI0004018C72|nr:PCYCGC motif-containing (lipo)protein [Ectobacillus panaciterrae]
MLYKCLIIALSPLLLFGAGISNTADAASEQYCFPGNYTETTASLSVLPSFLQNYEPEVKQVYKLAASHTELLQWIPCYCGCGQRENHQNNKDCFIREIKATGEVVWDTHAAHCINCLEIAREASLLAEQGKTKLAIRRHIDAKYTNSYAKPTPTPMPD